MELFSRMRVRRVPVVTLLILALVTNTCAAAAIGDSALLLAAVGDRLGEGMQVAATQVASLPDAGGDPPEGLGVELPAGFSALAYGALDVIEVATAEELIDALGAEGSGYTIKLMASFEVDMPPINKAVNLDASAHALRLTGPLGVGVGGDVTVTGDVSTSAQYAGAASASGGTLTVLGNVSTDAEYGTAALASDGGIVTVWGSATASGGYSVGAKALLGGTVVVKGTASGVAAGARASGGADASVLVEQDAIATGENGAAVDVSGGGLVTVWGDAKATGVYGDGVYARGGGKASIQRNLQANDYGAVAGDGGSEIIVGGNITGAHTGVSANDGIVTVTGSVTASVTGVIATGGAAVTVSGTLSAPAYINLNGTVRTAEGRDESTTKPGYDTYSHADSGSVVWVKQPGSYIVTYKDGTVTFGTQAVASGATTTAPTPAPTRVGHEFGGWYKDAECTDDWIFDTDTVAGPITLHAKWDVISYNVTFAPNGGTLSDGGGALEQYVPYGSEAIAPVLEWAGHTFKGWNVVFDNITSPLTVTAQWTINSYNVTFDPNGGTWASGGALEQYVDHGSGAVAPVLEWAGHTFEGWNVVFDDNITSPLTVIAQWSVNSYTVTYMDSDDQVATQSVLYGQLTTAPGDAPIRAGHTLNWYKEPACENAWVFASDAVLGPTTLYAKWTINQYTVTFNSRGGSAVANQSIAYGQSVVKPSAPTRSGYLFTGWLQNSNGTGPWSFESGKVLDNMTLYAGWSEIPTEPPAPPKPPVLLPTVSTDGASDLTLQSATLNGSIGSAGGANCTMVEFRFRQAEGGSWQTAGSQSVSLGDGGTFSTSVSGLKPNTAYEFQARAMNQRGWSAGGVVSFTTTAAPLPQVVTLPASGLTLQGAQLGGHVTDGVALIECGFLWGKAGSSMQRVSAGNTAVFETMLSGLSQRTSYSYQAYAENPAGTAYGEVLTFETPGLTVETLTETGVSKTGATLHGQLVGSAAPLSCGFAVYPEVTGNITVQSSADGNFSLTLTGLLPGTVYYVQAYVDAPDGQLYAGNSVSFPTLKDLPVVETGAASAINLIGARIAGNVAKNSGFAITERGFFFGTDPKPTAKLAAVIGADGRSFTAMPQDLLRATTYYYQAYAVNAQGIGLGEVRSFTTLTALPQVTTGSAHSDGVNVWQATLSGDIVDNGGSLSAYGFQYQVEGAADWQTLAVGSSLHTGQFVADLQAQQLTDGTKHYLVRAFATNSAGTAYGETLRIARVPAVQSLLDETTIGASTVTLRGQVKIPTPGTDATLIGFQLRLSGAEQWEDLGRQEGSFADDTTLELELTDLQPVKEYEFRVVAQNAVGWGYGAVIRFATTYGKTAREIAKNMRAAGLAASRVAQELQAKLKAPLAVAVDAVLFAGYSPVEAAAGLKASRYYGLSYGYDDIYMAREVAKQLKAAGIDSVDMARVFLQPFAGDLRYSRSASAEWRIAEELDDLDYTYEQIARALQEACGYGVASTAHAMVRYNNGSSTADTVKAIGAVYGHSALAHWLWNGPLPAALRLSVRTVRVFVQSMRPTDLSGEQIIELLQVEFPALTAGQAADGLKNAGYALGETATILQARFGLSAAGVAAALKQVYYSDAAILDWLVNMAKVTAGETAQIMRECNWLYAEKSIPAALVQYYELDGLQLVKTLYAQGWSEENNGQGPQRDGLGLYALIRFLLSDLGYSTPAQVIGVLRETGLSPLGVARMMAYANTLFRTSWNTYFLPAYRTQGYTATDAASWIMDVNRNYTVGDMVHDILRTDAGYTLLEIVLAVRNVNQLGAAVTLQELLQENANRRWGWSDDAISKAVQEVYGVDPYLLICQTMKAAGAPAAQTASTLKELLKTNSMLPVAEYLIQVEYGQRAVIEAMATVFGGGYSGDRLSLFTRLAELWQQVYAEQPEDLALLLSAANVTTHSQAIAVLHGSGRSLEQVTRSLRDIYSADVVRAYELLVACKFYSAAEIMDCLQLVYGADPIVVRLQALRLQGEPAGTGVHYLKRDFGITDPVQVLRYLERGGYSRADALSTQVNAYQPTLAAMQLVRDLTTAAFPDQTDVERFVWQVFLVTDAASANPVLNNMSELSSVDRAKVLRDIFGCDGTAVARLLHKYLNEDDVLPVLQEVFPEQDAILVLLGYLIADEGRNVDSCRHSLEKYGVTDIIEQFRYLRELGFSDDVILEELMDWSCRGELHRVFRAYFGATDLEKMAELMLTHPVLSKHLGLGTRQTDIPGQLLAAFPERTLGDVALTLMRLGITVDRYDAPSGRMLHGSDLVDWLRMQAHHVHQDASIAAILGHRNLHLRVHYASEILQSMGYVPLEIGRWLQQNEYTPPDMLYGLNKVFREPITGCYQSLRIMLQLGFDLPGLFRAYTGLWNQQSPSDPIGHIWALNDIYFLGGYTFKEVIQAYVRADCPLRGLPIAAVSVSRRQYNLEPRACYDSGLYDYNVLKATLVAAYAYEAMAGEQSLLELGNGFMEAIRERDYSPHQAWKGMQVVGSGYMRDMLANGGNPPGIDISDASVSSTTALAIMRDLGLTIDEAVDAMFDDNQEWMEALVIMICAGYDGGSTISTLWGHSGYHWQMGYAIIDMMSIAIRVGMDPGVLKIATMIYKLSNLTYNMSAAGR